jgi:hypothetical protein
VIGRNVGNLNERPPRPRSLRRTPPGRSPARQKRGGRGAAGQPRHAGGDRLLVDAPLSQGIPLRPARDRNAALAVVADPQPRNPDAPSGPERSRLRHDLEQGARRKSAGDDHAGAIGQARDPAGEPGWRASDRGRLGDALRQAVDSEPARRVAGGRLRPHPAHAALSAILRRDHGDGLRQGVRCAEDDAMAALASRRPALFRRSRLYRRPRGFDPRLARRARFRAGSAARIVPRHPAILFRPGRPLLLPLRENDAAAAKGARSRARSPADDVPVPVPS